MGIASCISNSLTYMSHVSTILKIKLRIFSTKHTFLYHISPGRRDLCRRYLLYKNISAKYCFSNVHFFPSIKLPPVYSNRTSYIAIENKLESHVYGWKQATLLRQRLGETYSPPLIATKNSVLIMFNFVVSNMRADGVEQGHLPALRWPSVGASCYCRTTIWSLICENEIGVYSCRFWMHFPSQLIREV